ncbi:MAG TPA: cell division protein ZapA [Bryobacteraceae bacterium]|nr:cell division protein ZapA [Bryobacteraceae bacterium]
MDSESSEKHSVRLNIYNQVFTLRAAGNATELEEAAHAVDDLMRSISRSGNMDATRVAILACLHLQARIRELENGVERLRGALDGIDAAG